MSASEAPLVNDLHNARFELKLVEREKRFVSGFEAQLAALLRQLESEERVLVQQRAASQGQDGEPAPVTPAGSIASSSSDASPGISLSQLLALGLDASLASPLTPLGQASDSESMM
eukprot:TRINITY_DN19337_c0_g1_i1.p1 TRINITY_DN19337_c0_g1~~TRINITY_DN19337_c0_g1_i1.p1  ORF type:complete len:116 (+),score=28.00 TRINITY_DN19337_c0_g1_i1:115-462(+)